MTTYEVQRIDGEVLASVETDGVVQPLRHLVHHSPDGFEYGYGGSGPSDLARSIIGHHFNTDDPKPAIYQAFKWEFVARWDPAASIHRVTSDEIDGWLRRPDTREIVS